MNLNEEKRKPLANIPTDQKRKMVQQFQISQFDSSQQQDGPSDYLRFLSSTDHNIHKLGDKLNSLRISLTAQPVSWIQEFGAKGLTVILEVLERISIEFVFSFRCLKNYTINFDFSFCRINSNNNSINAEAAKVQLECVRCVRAFSNNKVKRPENEYFFLPLSLRLVHIAVWLETNFG